MKKWIYIIVPSVLLALFLGFYIAHQKEAETRARTQAEQVVKKLAEDKKQKQALEDNARESAKVAQQERAAVDAKKESERRAKLDANDRKVKEATDTALAEADKLQKRAAALEIELDRLHKEKDRLNREAFDLAKQVELAMVAKQNAELEAQRLIAMIADKAAKSALARMPLPPPPPPPK